MEATVDVSFTTNETAILRRALLSGGGIGILPTYYFSEGLRRGELVPLLRDYPLETLGIHAVFLSRQHQPLALRLLVDFLAEKFGGGGTGVGSGPQGLPFGALRKSEQARMESARKRALGH
ncbi:LysR substrate-binding domain-containing protein [Hylemonella gracilis]|uniref:LysR family transcriptional regulator n=1 Tax=Hylemonella gracilis ATCC 19624 TaxID=887062 RepID=F3KU28_9BURK|nr:LysR substrate-binding domain-containing protein [Hylemonella gracilis]EGI76711.1 LysR family transcriptional regulator [Hylemonella gracilis ATCC 19624]